MTATTAPSTNAQLPSSYADRLRNVRVGTRQDLSVTRHLFRGEPAYVVTDPMTLQNHRFDPADYTIFVAIDRRRELQEVFEELVAHHTLAQEDEERFYHFVFRLHQLGFLSLPFSDDKLLYRRYVRQKKLKLKQKVTGFLFLQIPLVNPDRFLERTLHYGKHVFSRWFFCLWVCLVAVAGFVAFKSFHELIQPIQGVLLPQNLPMMWLTLIVLKLFHEFGHAYATKRFGGYVPEMGAYLIMFTPCAYVDATACWGFTRRRDRVIVCLAGMYVESILAALAVLLWSMTEPGRLHDLAYNVIVLASVVTAFFNINPLMRFDGYYVLSDLLEIPNLRARSAKFTAGVAKRIFLSLRDTAPVVGFRLRAFLLSFGIAASIYRVSIIIGIAAVVAYKIPGVGLGLAGLLFGSTVFGMLVRLTRYLWRSDETAPVRRRAVVLSTLLLIGAPGMVLLIPVPSSVRADGVFERTDDYVIRTRVAGFIRSIPMRLGDRVAPGDILAELENETLAERMAEVSAVIEASSIRHRVFEVDDPAMAKQEQEQLSVLRDEQERRRRDEADLTVRAETPGAITDCLRTTDFGRFLQEGDPVASVASGTWQVRAILAEDEMASSIPGIGDSVEIRSLARPGESIRGHITAITPAASRTITSEALTHLGGGSVAVNPETAEAAQPYFEITVDTGLAESPFLRHGMVCQLRFGADPETVGTKTMRRLLRFVDSVSQR